MPDYPDDIHLSLHFLEGTIPRFFQLLQQGFIIKPGVGCSIKDLLCGQFGLSPEYFEERVQTIFLDGNPVDDANSATVKDGSCIAISGAMPGLVGAVLRKGGFYASMRGEISYREEGKPDSYEDGVVFLKIFNILLKDLGPAFLEKGIRINSVDLERFFQKQLDDFWAGFCSAALDGKDLTPEELMSMKWPDKQIFLQVRSCE